MTSDFSLLDLVVIVLKKKKALCIHLAAATAVAVGIALVLPKSYKASVVFIPQSQGASGLFSMISDRYSGDILGSAKLSKRQYVALLRSRELREQLIQKFDLIHVYKLTKSQRPLDAALKQLDQTVQVSEEEEGGLGITDVVSVSIAVVDESPTRASDMANAMYELLEGKAISLNGHEYGQMERFLTKEIGDCEKKLQEARAALTRFQMEKKAYDVPMQAMMAIRAAGRIQADIYALEKEKSLIRQVYSPDFPYLRTLNEQIAALKKGIDDLENEKQGGQGGIAPSLTASLTLSNEYADLLLNVETFTQLRLLLRQQFEQAIVKERKDYSGLYLVDAARPPQGKFKPKRAFVVLGIVIPYLLLVVAFYWLQWFFYYLRRTNPAALVKIDELLSAVKR